MNTAVDHLSLLKADRIRHTQALNAALDQTELLQQHVQLSTLLSSESIRDKVAVRLIEHSCNGSQQQAEAPGISYSSSGKEMFTQPHGQQQNTSETARLLLENVKIKHAEVYSDQLAAIAADSAALQISSAALEKDEEQLRKRFVQKHLSLAAAIQDDARLATMTEAEILQEVRAKGAEMAKRKQMLQTVMHTAWRQHCTSHQDGGGSNDTAAVPHKTTGRQGATDYHGKNDDSGYEGRHEDEYEDQFEDQYEDEYENEYEEECEVQSCSSNTVDSGTGFKSQTGTRQQQQSENGARHHAAAAAAKRRLLVEQGLPAMLQHMSVQRHHGIGSRLQLSDVAAAVSAQLPQQQEQLAAIKRRTAVTTTRLQWQVQRPKTYAGDLALTAHQRSIRGLAQSIIDGLMEAALGHIAMRPTKQQVAVEIAEWKAARPAALAAISRHVGDSIYKEVVEELLQEITAEAAAAAAAADTFSFDMLVAAVAFSQGKYDLGFNPGIEPCAGLGFGSGGSAARSAAAEDGQVVSSTVSTAAAGNGAYGRQRGRSVIGGVAREAALLQKAAEIEATAAAEAAAAAEQGRARLVISAGDVQIDIPEEDVYLARRDFAAADHVFALQQQNHGKKGAQLSQVSARVLYMAGLRGMLWEMRKRRPPDTPYGHTQHLTPFFSQGAAISKARKIAVNRMRPPLAATAGVWARREAPTGRLDPGGWPSVTHLSAATRERDYWAKVPLRPRMQRVALPAPADLANTSLLVPEALGSVTALSGCPAGTFIAAGTSRGALLVWDVRKDTSVSPWFQVTGAGQLYKRRWWNPWAAKPPRRPAIAGFAWSSDSYQLAGLDASSNLKMWWMRPEERADGQSVAELQAKNAPVTPELAVLLTPFMVTISGKAPLAEEDDNAPTLATPESNSSKGGLTYKLGQWLGLLETEAKAVIRDVPPRQWRPVMHPACTITGTQPTVVIPQVTGDVLSLTTDIGGPVLPGFGPTAFAERANVATGLAAATAGISSSMAATPAATWKPLGGVTGAAAASLPQAVVDFLMPPQAINPDIISQSLYRGHDAHVVFLGFLSDSGSLISLDTSGCLVLWPASSMDRSGFGWIAPKKRWQLPHSIRMCQLRGGMQPIWPVLSGRAARKSSGASSSTLATGYAHDKQDKVLLQQDPTGEFWLHTRLPWLVRYLPASNSGSKGRAVRQVLHRPLDNSQPGSNIVAVSSYDALTGELLMRGKQHCAFIRTTVKVVAAEMTQSKRELVLVCSVQPQQGDAAGMHTFSVLVINLASMRQWVPRIDVHDPSGGAAAPAYALSPTLSTTGSDYLFMNLGCGVIGTYSLATGQLVREIVTYLQDIVNAKSCYFCSLALLKVTEKHGGFSNAGRNLLCCAAVGGQAVYVLELGLEEAARQTLEKREQQKVAQQ